jgi:alkylhydroperoxidase family enzyme
VLLKSLAKHGGPRVPEIWNLLQYKPEATAHLNAYTEAVMRGPSPLSPGLRELIAAFTSKCNHCVF